MHPIYHALVLNLHQPSGNLEYLLEKGDGWEGKEILYSLDRMPRSLWGYEDIARVHLSLSGTLLETLLDPEFQEKYYGTVKIGDLLWQLQNKKIFEILGTGYYHPVFPLIPQNDWSEQITRWQGVGKHTLWRENFNGFWLPEMSFSMEMIPLLKKHGYNYVIADIENIEPTTPMSWEELRYRPHIARYKDEEIIVIVRDRELSNAQESGMDTEWFINEAKERTKYANFPALITTCTDGENGGWFRNHTEQSNFWNAFYQPLLEKSRTLEAQVFPTFITDYIKEHGTLGEVHIHTAAWNTGDHSGRNFTQWTGSTTQKKGFERMESISNNFHEIKNKVTGKNRNIDKLLAEAEWRLLRAQTSCNYYWGEDWVYKSHKDLDTCAEILNRIKNKRHQLSEPPHTNLAPKPKTN